MDLSTNAPGLQFYSGNFLNGSLAGKGAYSYPQHDGFTWNPRCAPPPCSLQDLLRQSLHCPTQSVVAMHELQARETGAAESAWRACQNPCILCKCCEIELEVPISSHMFCSGNPCKELLGTVKEREEERQGLLIYNLLYIICYILITPS